MKAENADSYACQLSQFAEDNTTRDYLNRKVKIVNNFEPCLAGFLFIR